MHGVALRYFDLALSAERDRVSSDADLEVVLGQAGHIGAKDEAGAVVIEPEGRAGGRYGAVEIAEQAIELAAQLDMRDRGAPKVGETEAGPVVEITESGEHVGSP